MRTRLPRSSGLPRSWRGSPDRAAPDADRRCARARPGRRGSADRAARQVLPRWPARCPPTAGAARGQASVHQHPGERGGETEAGRGGGVRHPGCRNEARGRPRRAHDAAYHTGPEVAGRWNFARELRELRVQGCRHVVLHDSSNPSAAASRPRARCKPVNADQHQHVARPFRQRRDGALEIERRGAGIRIGPLGQPRGRLRDLVRGPQAAPARDHGADRDALQPGREAAALLEARQPAPGRDEGLLHAVLGGLALPGEAQAQAVGARREAAIERFEGGEIARDRGGDEPGRLQVLLRVRQLQLMY